MTFKQLVPAALYNFSALKDARQNKFWKSLLYLLLLSVILAIPLMVEAGKTLHTLQTDTRKIAAKLPDFTIENNQLQTATDTKGFIYQTNSVIFTFDPAGKRSANDVASDIQGNQFAIGLLKDQVVVALPDSAGVGAALYGSNLLKFSYTDANLKSLTGKAVKETFTNFNMPKWIHLLVVIIAVIPTFIDLFLTLIIASFFANLFARMTRKSVRYSESLKTMIYAATLPVIVSTIVLLFNQNFSSDGFIWVATFIIFTRVARHFPVIKN